ncbi:MAG: hypothetical protein [Caudoviricetes sp.]|nr:MAG: hypothetical protein [Caudoviricetes sp.]
MTTETVLTENIANIVDCTAGNLEQAVRDAIDGYESDYDIERATKLYAEEMEKQLAPLGVTSVLYSGEVRCKVNAKIDQDKVAEIVKGIDLGDILDSCIIA